MASVQFVDPNCQGVSIRDEYGNRTPFKRPEKGRPVIEVSAQQADALSGVPGVQASRSTGRAYNIPADFLPSAEELIAKRFTNGTSSPTRAS